VPPPLPAKELGARRVTELATLERHFERMLGSLTMHFQPIVRAEDHALFGYEALMRPNDPDLPHPGAALDAAESLHRLQSLGRTVRGIAARTFSESGPDDAVLFVNLHALDLLDKTLTSRWSSLARLASRVILEITERESVQSISDLRFRLAQLREMGFRLAIDDLGAGHSRMGNFDPRETDVVKLDMSLVRDVDTNAGKRQVAQAIIGLCHDSGIQVVGEGVETIDECRALRDIGCDLLQGFFIARPAPVFQRPDLRQ